jgi:drug/metabolite transporter (DMT)-like permease
VRSAASHRLGIFLMIGATVCWASAGVLVRTLALKDAWEITFWRSFFMALFLLGVIAVQYRGEVWSRIVATGRAGLVSGMLWAIMYVCFIVALSLTTVANTLIVCSISPFMSALFGRLFLHEHVPGRTWAAMSVAVTGIVLMFVEGVGSEGWSGILLALVIPVAFGMNVVLNRRMHATVDMVPTVFISGVFSCAMTLPFALPLEAAGSDFANLVTLGVVQLGLGCLLMVVASRHLRAAEVGLLAELETVLGVASTWALVGEAPSRMALIGGIAVIVALAADTLFGLTRSRGSVAVTQ